MKAGGNILPPSLSLAEWDGQQVYFRCNSPEKKAISILSQSFLAARVAARRAGGPRWPRGRERDKKKS